jgi:hypothetical protein
VSTRLRGLCTGGRIDSGADGTLARAVISFDARFRGASLPKGGRGLPFASSRLPSARPSRRRLAIS